jgi:hypothetical protein
MAENSNAASTAAASSSHGLSSDRLPPFWSNSPAAWFRTIEAQFIVRAITDPVDHYYVVMAALWEQQSELVSNILDEEPSAESYQLLKAALLSSHSLTPYQMVDKLVNLEALGGRKPSELMAAMQKLQPPKDEHFFVYHFLQRLPKEVCILLAHDNFADMRKLAEKVFTGRRAFSHSGHCLFAPPSTSGGCVQRPPASAGRLGTASRQQHFHCRWTG